MQVELEEMLIEKAPNDPLKRISGQLEDESHFIVGRTWQVISPQTDDESPFKISINVGEHSHYYATHAYSVTDWLIDMGGISRSVFIGGMLIAHLVASHMQ